MSDSDTPEVLPPDDQPEPMAEGPLDPAQEPAGELPPTYIGPAADFGGMEGAESAMEPGDVEPEPIPSEAAARVYETPVVPSYVAAAEPPPETPPPSRPQQPSFTPPPSSPEEGKRNWLLYGLGGGALLICALCACLIGVAAMSGALDEGTTVETGDNGGSNGAATVVVGSPAPTTVRSTATVEVEDISVFDLQVGNCFNDPQLTVDGLVEDIGIVDCEQPHDNEMYFTIDYPAGSSEAFPGEEEIDAFAEEECLAAFEGYVGVDFNDSILQVSYFQPTETSWDGGDREIACFLYEEGERLEGSMEGSER